MKNYNIFSDYEKQQKLKEIKSECERLNKSKYWVLKQLGIPKSTYYNWLKTGGVTKSKAPKTVWNKTPRIVEDKILELRDNNSIYKSKRTPVGIANALENYGVFMTSVGIWNVLKRNKKIENLLIIKKHLSFFQEQKSF